MKKYKVYVRNAKNNVFMHPVAADTETAARKYMQGAGEFIGAIDVTEDYPISLAKVEDALGYAGFGTIETQLILQILEDTGIAE